MVKNEKVLVKQVKTHYHLTAYSVSPSRSYKQCKRAFSPRRTAVGTNTSTSRRAVATERKNTNKYCGNSRQ